MATYTVKRGDTLSAIAARNNTTVSKLAKVNGIRNINLIYVNQRLQIPKAGNAGTSTASAGASKVSKKTSTKRSSSAPKPQSVSGTVGTRSWFQSVATKATARAGVPSSWARSSALANLVQRESGYRPTAQNPSSTAYGLFQFLNSTWKGTGVSKTSDPVQQTVAGLRYIKQRYGSPEAAMSFWNRNKWY